MLLSISHLSLSVRTLCETSHSRGSDSGVFVSMCVSVCAPVPVCVSTLVTDLCVSCFSLPRSLHRGCSSVCQTGEHSFKSSQLSISHFASNVEIFRQPLCFFLEFSDAFFLFFFFVDKWTLVS